MNRTPDTLTVLRSQGPRLAKLLHADGQCEPYDRARTFTMHPVPVDGVGSLARLLARLLLRPDCCAIRGAPLDPANTSPVRRLLYSCRQTGELPTVREQARHWLALDVDGLPRPPDVPAADLAACARAALAALPPAFTGAKCVVQATAGHAVKPGLRLRLWFWCSLAMAGGELKRWLCPNGAAPSAIDQSVFAPAQMIYTAAPVFAPGAADPLPARLLVLDGAEAVVPPPPASLTPPPLPPRPDVATPVTLGTGASYTRHALARAVQRITSGGPRHPAIVSEARSLARLVAAGWLAESELRAVLHEAARQAGKDDEGEVAKCIAWGLAHPSTGRVPEVAHG